MTSVLVVHSQSLRAFPSGELQVALAEKKMLSERGVAVELVEFVPKRQPASALGKAVHAAVVNIWSTETYRFMTERIAAVKPDIVHFHGLFPYLSASAMAAAHDAGAAVVQTLHNGRWLCLEGGFYRDGRYCDDCVGHGGWAGVRHGCKHGVAASLLCHAGNLSGLAGGRLFRWVDRFIAVSDFIRDQHVRDGFPPEKIVVKNNGVDVERLRAVPPAAVRAGVAYVGRVSQAKGSGILKALAAEIRDEIHVVGDGPDLPSLQRHCEAHGYLQVKFWGKQSQARCFEIMASAVCTVVPSQCGESFSLVAAESMGLGTPIVGSDVGGLGPLLRAAGGGRAVAPANTRGFVDAVRQMLEQPDLAAKFGAAGQRYVEQQLDITRNAAELVAIYEAVLKEKKRHADHV